MYESMGWALKYASTGPAIVTLRHRTPVVKGVEAQDGSSNMLVLEELIELQAVSWRSVGEDGWEISIDQTHPQSGTKMRVLWYVNGSDILSVAVPSKISSS